MNATLPAPETLADLWTFSNPFGPLSQPLTLAGDRLLGVSGNNTLFALDLYEGRAVGTTERVAQQNFPYTFQSFYGSDPHVTAAGGNVYFMDGDQMIALRLADGAPLPGWQPPALKQVNTLFAAEGRVIAVGSDPATGGAMVAGYADVTGAPLFGPLVVSPRSPGAIGYGHKAVFFVADGALNAVNVNFGDVRWRYTPPAGEPALDLSVAPVLAGDVVLIGGGDLIALDRMKGNVRWRVAPTGAGPVRWFAPAPTVDGKSVIAINTGGEVCRIALADGAVQWRFTGIAQPGAPAVVENRVSFTVGGGRSVALLVSATGALAGHYELPSAAGAQPIVVGNDTIFIPTAGGAIVARAFAKQNAARFDGITARIDITPDATQFDFGLGDFTVEAWIKSSVGGEIVSSYPTAGGPLDHGFRFNLSPKGEFRIVVMNASRKRLNRAKSAATHAVDGEWHHVALLRRTGVFVVLLDGIALDLDVPAGPAELNSISGRNALTIGACVLAKDVPPEEHFLGLIREVRIWDRALDVATIVIAQAIELTGREPRLKGLWRLDENQVPGKPLEPVNEVRQHRNPATFLAARSAPTDLVMDESAFPYLIQESTPLWPYAGTWGARGELPATSTPAVSSNSVLAFATNNRLYGVRKADGHRLWSCDLAEGGSAPTADGTAFLVLSGEESLLEIDALTGAATQLPGFGALTNTKAAFYAAPAASASHFAAASPEGLLAIRPRTGGDAVRGPLGFAPQRLEFGAGGLFVSGTDQNGAHVVRVNPASAAILDRVAVASPLFALAGDGLIVVQADGIKRLDTSRPHLPVAATTTAVPVADITGFAAWPDSDLLVVATRNGIVHGLSLVQLARCWQTELPPGAATGSRTVHAPAFDENGRIHCTTADGLAAVLDPDTGDLLGRFHEPQAIVTAPRIDAGTAYFGCADTTDPHAECDGAVHSVVFGETMALRLGLDTAGAPANAAPNYARIEAAKKDCTLHLMDVTQSCFEAWLNIPALDPATQQTFGGGGIFGLCPSDGNDAFDLNVWIDRAGVLHYVARSKETAGWKGLHAEAHGAVADGRWHHVAISRRSESDLIIYVDGVALPDVTTSVIAEAPAHFVPGLQAFIGANADDALAPTRPFCGLIAEVRVWDTYLQPQEIASRLHVKLRGDEPDLIAYWNFDREAVHDSAAAGHDGTLVNPAGLSSWWLVDLPFTQPAYPHLVTAAKIIEEAEARTTYELELSARRADGGGLPEEQVRVWYVRRAPSEPATITLDGRTLVGVPFGHEPEPPAAAPAADAPISCYEVKLNTAGRRRLTVSTTLAGHGPSLDIHSAFMPDNERFHVNCLLDNQRLAKPAPPVLTAQAKLIQDYHYSPGGTIDHTRDRSTYRVVLHATNVDRTPRRGELITVWAEKSLEVEADGATHTITAENPLTLAASDVGELVVAFAADELHPPMLYARAGFMHRNDRIVINPAEEAHQQLAAIQEHHFTQPRLVNWKPNATDADRQTMLDSQYHEHAPRIATAIRNTMSIAQRTPPPPRSTPSALPPRAPLAAMRQPRAAARADQAVVLRTFAGVPRQPAFNADAFRASLGGNHGFVIAVGQGRAKFSYATLATPADVARERGVPTRPVPALGSFFDDVGDTLSSAGNAIKDAATNAVKIVVSAAEKVKNAVEVAIHTLTDVVHVVVDSVKKAVSLVVEFCKKLGLMVWKIILFLRALFDWGGIRAAQRLMKRMLKNMAGILTDPAFLRRACEQVDAGFDKIENLLGLPPPQRDPTSVTDAGSSDPGGRHETATEHAHSVQSRMIAHKMHEHGGAVAFPGTGGAATMAEPAGLDLLHDFFDVLADLAPDACRLDYRSLAESALRALKKLAGGVVEDCRAWTKAAIRWLTQSLRKMFDELDHAIDVPFVGSLYKWISGEELTMMNVITLMMGLPVHVAYFVATNGSRFCDDAEHWVEDPATTHSLGMSNPLNPALNFSGFGQDDWDHEFVYTIIRSMHTLAVVATDATFSRGGETRARGFHKFTRGLFGVFTTFWAAAFTFPYFIKRVDGVVVPGGKIDTTSRHFGQTHLLDLILGLVGDGITLAGGIARIKSGDATALPAFGPAQDGHIPAPGEAGGPAAMETGKWDQLELCITSANAVLAIVQIALQVDALEHSPDCTSENPDNDVRDAARLLRGRYISVSIPKLFGWMFTQTSGGNLLRNRYVQAVVTGVRASANTSGVVCHSVALYRKLDI